MKTKTEQGIREMLRQFIAIEYRTQTAFAAEAGVTVQYICNIINGKKAMPSWIAERYLGYERVEPEPQPVRFRRIR